MGGPRQLGRAFNNPYNILLIVLAVISYVTGDMKAAIILSLMVGLSSLLRFVQEFRSSNAAETVITKIGNPLEIPNLCFVGSNVISG